MTKQRGRYTKFLTGYRPVVHAREGRMFGMRKREYPYSELQRGGLAYAVKMGSAVRMYP